VLEFNRNPKSVFTENEMMAFAPSRLVPGIEPSDDKLLQARLMAYADAQRYRLGTNFQLLPVNAPQCPFFNGNVDGFMNFHHHPSSRVVNYFPSLSTGSAFSDLTAKALAPTIEAPKYHHETQELVYGSKVRESIPHSVADYSQAGDRYRSFDSERKERFAERIALTLSEPGINDVIVSVWVDRHWRGVDAALPEKIRKYMRLYLDSERMKEDPLLESRRAAFEKTNGGPMPLNKIHTVDKSTMIDQTPITFGISH